MHTHTHTQKHINIIELMYPEKYMTISHGVFVGKKRMHMKSEK